MAGIAGLVCLGLSASGLLRPAPEAWRVLAALLGVLVLPSFLLLPAALTLLSRTAAVVILATAFLLWLSALALWTEGFTRAGAGFGAYADATVWTLLAVFGGSVAVGRPWRGPFAPGHRARGPVIRAIVAVALVALAASVVPFTFTAGEDAPDHAGYLRRVVDLDSLRPDGVLAARAGTPAPMAADPRKGALHPALALVAGLSDADPVVVWRWLPVVMFPAAVFAFVGFSGVFLASARARALCLILFLLSYNGDAFQLASASAYGQNLAADWGWILFPAALGAARGGVWRPVALLLLAAGGVFVHLGVLVHATVIAGTIALFGSAFGLDRRGRLLPAMLVGGGAILAWAVRAMDAGGPMNVVHGHVQGVLFITERFFVASPMEILRQHGMVFLGGLAVLPLLAVLAWRRADARAIAAASALPLVVSFTPLAVALFERGSYMVFRALLTVPAFPAVVVAGVWLAGTARARGLVARVLAAVLLLAWALTFVRPALDAFAGDARRTAVDRADPPPLVTPELRAVVGALPAGRTLLSDPATSYLLSAYTSHRFVTLHQQHGNPRDPDALDRLQAVRDVFSPFAVSDAAVSACRRYAVDYVVVNSAKGADASEFLSLWDGGRYATALRRLDSMPASFARVDSVRGGVVYRFEPAAAVNISWSAPAAPVRAESPALRPCAFDAPDEAFRVTGVAVDPPRALPGDTVTVTIGYRRDLPSAFGLPLLIHLRFDHESVSPVPRYPGEKFVRRADERFSGSFLRFRHDARPGHGVFEPDLWPIGTPLCERFRVTVPRAARLGRYRLEVGVVRDSLLPNFHLSDLFYNRDHYAGRACAELVVSDRVIGEGAVP